MNRIKKIFSIALVSVLILVILDIFVNIIIINSVRNTDYNHFNEVTNETLLAINDEINSMSLEEKVGQMFIVKPETFSTGGPVTNFSQLDTELMEKYNIGGMVMFETNIITPDQISSLNSGLKNFDNSIFLCIGEEGGEHSKIANTKSFPDELVKNMSEIGNSNNPKEAYRAGDTIGNYLYKYNFNVNFAPVCDVYLNDKNTVIMKRSFGSDPEIVSKMSANFMQGLHNHKILATAKHFPGYGSSSTNSQIGLPISNSTMEDLNTIELIPFENLIKNNVDFIMTSLVIYPNLSDKDLPATINPDIITGILKNKLGYKGIIITEALDTGVFAYNYDNADIAVQSVIAGNDILLMPPDFFEAYDAIIDAVNNGTISEERINESVRKILLAKSKIL